MRSPICRGRWLFTGLLLIAIGSVLAARGEAQEAPRPLLLLISIDGLRPDYVTAADSYQAKIPHLRRFLKDGAFADGAEGVIPTVTYPSHTTPGLLAELEPDLGSYPRALDIEADELRGRYAVRILEAKRPGLLTLHLIALDHIRHETGPGTREIIAVLERLDAVVGALRDAAERVSPGRAILAIVSDHGFARTDAQLNLFPAFRDAGLFSDDGKGRISEWRAMPWNGIDRVLEADALHQRGGFPTASFLVGLKPGWRTGSSLTGPVRSTLKPGGTHGHLPDLPELRASFFLVGPGVPAARSLGLIDMRDVAGGKILFP
jgi:predicted AlkP superfamily pyrophosphatase or phosphodiesterase